MQANYLPENDGAITYETPRKKARIATKRTITPTRRAPNKRNNKARPAARTTSRTPDKRPDYFPELQAVAHTPPGHSKPAHENTKDGIQLEENGSDKKPREPVQNIEVDSDDMTSYHHKVSVPGSCEQARTANEYDRSTTPGNGAPTPSARTGHTKSPFYFSEQSPIQGLQTESAGNINTYGDYSQNAFPEDPFVEPAWKTSESEALAYELALRNKTPSPENRINYSEYFPEYPQDVQELAECEPRAHVPRDLFNPRDLTTDMY